MEAKEKDKLNKIISNGYKDLIEKRPEKPLHHFIAYLMQNVTEEEK